MRIVVIILSVIFSFNCFAKKAVENVDWGKIEKCLYQELKEKGSKSDAEIHQAIGYALLKTEDRKSVV